MSPAEFSVVEILDCEHSRPAGVEVSALGWSVGVSNTTERPITILLGGAERTLWPSPRRAECDLVGVLLWRSAGFDFRVVGDAALEVLGRVPSVDNPCGLIFPSRDRPGYPLSNVAYMNLLKRLGYADRTTAHGFRATFRTWATECADASARVKKLSTAHAPGDKIEDAYDRALVLDPRRQLMQRWGCYVMGRSDPVR